jgi:hypothetical protein
MLKAQCKYLNVTLTWINDSKHPDIARRVQSYSEEILIEAPGPALSGRALKALGEGEEPEAPSDGAGDGLIRLMRGADKHRYIVSKPRSYRRSCRSSAYSVAKVLTFESSTCRSRKRSTWSVAKFLKFICRSSAGKFSRASEVCLDVAQC